MLEYEVANPGQDDDDKDKEEKEEEEGAKAGARGEKPGLEGSGMERV
jgi:aquaporin related protein